MGKIEHSSPAQPLCRSHGLWSLWDMLHVNARAFYEASATLSSIRGSIVQRDKHDELVDPDYAISVVGIVGQLQTEAEILGATNAVVALQRIYARLDDKGYATTYGQLIRLIEDVESRLVDELKHKFVFALDERKTKFYRAQGLFGADFGNKFPGASYELDEAGKCLALERSTAAVFHLMRLLEIGVGAARQCLGIPDPIKASERNWGEILRKFKDEFSARNAAKPARWSGGDKDFFAEVYASLDAIKNVWRNATMHVEKKYTAEEAEDIFNAVRGFMRKLASRLDENGEPKA